MAIQFRMATQLSSLDLAATFSGEYARVELVFLGTADMHEQDHARVEVWIEVIEPLADAMNLLAGAIEGAPGDLNGVSIALSDQETLLLNHGAWIKFSESLKALHGLKTRHVTRDEMRPVRFLLIAADRVSTDVPG